MSREARRARIEELFRVYEEEIATLDTNYARLEKENSEYRTNLRANEKLIIALKNDNKALTLQLGKRTPVKLGKHMLETTSAEMEFLRNENRQLVETVKDLQHKLTLHELNAQSDDGHSAIPDAEQSSDSGFADRHYNKLTQQQSYKHDHDFINLSQPELACREHFQLTHEDINIIYEETLPASDNVEFFNPMTDIKSDFTTRLLTTPRKGVDRIDVNSSPSRLPKNIKTRPLSSNTKPPGSGCGGRTFQISRTGLSSLHSISPPDPHSTLQPFRRTSPMKLRHQISDLVFHSSSSSDISPLEKSSATSIATTVAVSSPRKHSINILRRRRIAQKTAAKSNSLVKSAPSPNKSRRKQTLC